MPSNWRPPSLDTTRLILRPLEESDAEAIFAYASNPNMTRYTLWDWHRELNDTMEFLNGYVKGRYLEGVLDPLGICLKGEPARVIGTIGCFWNTRKNQTMEMGFALGEKHWGQGIVAEAGRALLQHAFATYEVERVQAHCIAPNNASARVLEKLGMTYEGCLRSALFHRGQFWDLLMYSILRRERTGAMLVV
jgi:ribosomal-protein-alanine N-acetyltransferase